MQKKKSFLHNPRRLFGILLLVLLFLGLPIGIFLIQRQSNGTTPGQSNGTQPNGSNGTQPNGTIVVGLVPPGIALTLTPSATPTFIVPASYAANIDFESMASYGTYNPAALANPNITAVDINMNWVSVEPQQGVFNWGPADNEIAAWAAHGKKFTIVARFINEGTGNCNGFQLMPAWEIARVPNFCSTTGQIIPDYFDATFIADFKAYVQAIAQHIAASPYRNNLLYIRLGIGMGGEGFPVPDPTNPDTPDKAQLQTYGYTPTLWASWQRAMMTYYKSVFPLTTIIYPVNGQDIDPATGQNVSIENANWAAANGFGVGQQGLQPGTRSPLFQSLRARYPKLYIQYQTDTAVDSYTAVQEDIQAAESNGAQSIEWYSRNAVNPDYQPLFAQWQQTVNSTFRTP